MLKTVKRPKPANHVKKPITQFRIKVRSRHPSHDVLRDELPRLPFRSVVRLGSTTTVSDGSVECNSIKGVTTSSNKREMKHAFIGAGIRTPEYFVTHGGGNFVNKINGNNVTRAELPYPIVAKAHYGSRGKGNHLLQTQQELTNFLNNHNASEYIFEKYYNYNKEYRLHVTSEGCFYACRKMLKEGTPDNKKWQRHDDNCVWILETNPKFDKPANWNTIVEHCVKAIRHVGLDIGACDVRVQNNTTGKGKGRDNIDFVILETNSAPSFGDLTKEKYLIEIPKVLRRKAGR